MNSIKKHNILGVNIAAVDMKRTLELITENLEVIKGQYICVSNVHTTVMANENETYNKVQNSSFLSLPDGKPLSIIAQKRGCKKIQRVTGPDLMEEIFRFENKKYKHYFYGTTQENLDALKSYLDKEYPELDVVGMKPSVFRDLTDDENEKLIEEFIASEADFIWIALGAPRQEIFMYNNKEKTNAVMIGVGGAFNVLSGVSPRAPQWMQDMSLEWLFRLADDPKRLWKRYVVTNSKFIFKLLKTGVENEHK